MAELQVPVVKSKGGFIAVDLDKIPEDVVKEIWMQGLKTLVNRGMTKITTTGLEGKELDKAKADAMAKASENLEAIYTSKIRFTGGKKKQATGEIMTEARRLAKALVKDAMKRDGIKVSTVEAKEITRLANELLDDDPSIIESAKANVEARKQKTVSSSIMSTIKISDKLVKKAQEKKSQVQAAKATLSAAKVGQPKARPQANA